jgi:glucan phosphoethanolaminetransferase (alkaline phosphatase superfamily)
LEWPDIAVLPLIFFLLVTAGAMLTWTILPWLLGGHHWLQRRFQESVQARENARRTQARILVGVLLSLAYFVVIYFASYKAVLNSIFPLAGIMEGVIPSGYWAVMAQTWPMFLLVLFGGSFGPATLYAIVWFRRKDNFLERKDTVLNVLQLLCYLSWLFLALCFSTESAMQIMYFERTYFMTILPGTLVSLVVVHFFEPEGGL